MGLQLGAGARSPVDGCGALHLDHRPLSSDVFAMSDIMTKGLRTIDQFRTVSKEISAGTVTGGVCTLVAYLLLVLLLFAEVVSFLSDDLGTDVVLDEMPQGPGDRTTLLHFDITMLDLPCKNLRINVLNKYGPEKLEDTLVEQTKYLSVDHAGNEKGSVYSHEEIAALEQADLISELTDDEKAALDSDWGSTTDHFKHQDFESVIKLHDFTFINFYAMWCSHCRNFYPMWMEMTESLGEKATYLDADGQERKVKFLHVNCVDFQDLCREQQVMEFPTLRFYKTDGSFERLTTRGRDTVQSFLAMSVKHSHHITAQHHAMFKEGCRASGSLVVPRVPGHFDIQAQSAQGIDLDPALTNVSHIVHALYFGEPDSSLFPHDPLRDEIFANVNPLAGQTFRTARFHEAAQHYLQVVSTKVKDKPLFFQITHTDRIRRLSSAADRHLVPSARFTYEFSPLSVRVKRKGKRWYQFLTSLLAILGGTFTTVQACSGAVDSVGSVVKEALGKQN